jgi:hypothetical protein
MKIKTTVLGVAAVLVLAVTPTFLIAQGVHSQFAIAQPAPPFTPTQAPAIATRIPYRHIPAGSSPIGIIQAPVIVPSPVFNPTPVFSLDPTFGVSNQVFAPNPVFAPTTVFNPAPSFIPNQFVFPNAVSSSLQMQPQVTLPQTQLLLPGQTVVPPATTTESVTAPVQAYFGVPPALQQKLAPPAVGTARADVLQKFGQPIATVTTRTGETLYFSDGTKVILQNGQVTGSK